MPPSKRTIENQVFIFSLLCEEHFERNMCMLNCLSAYAALCRDQSLRRAHCKYLIRSWIASILFDHDTQVCHKLQQFKRKQAFWKGAYQVKTYVLKAIWKVGEVAIWKMNEMDANCKYFIRSRHTNYNNSNENKHFGKWHIKTWVLKAIWKLGEVAIWKMNEMDGTLPHCREIFSAYL